MQCPHCSSSNTKRNGKTAKGTQRYYCTDCSSSFTGSAVGRPSILGDRPLTEAERKRWQRKRQLPEV